MCLTTPDVMDVSPILYFHAIEFFQENSSVGFGIENALQIPMHHVYCQYDTRAKKHHRSYIWKSWALSRTDPIIIRVYHALYLFSHS